MRGGREVRGEGSREGVRGDGREVRDEESSVGVREQGGCEGEEVGIQGRGW